MTGPADTLAKNVAVQVIGFGPASLGLPLAADRAGRLGDLLHQGLVYVEQEREGAALARRRFPFVIESNSPGGDFVRAIDPDGVFGSILRTPAAARILARRDDSVPLADVGELMNELSRRVGAACRASGHSGLLDGVEIAAVRREGDGTFTSLDRRERAICRSRFIVFAAGGTELPPEGSELFPFSEWCLPSAAVLAGDLRAVERLVAESRPVNIVGGSHSAFASAALILKHLGDRLGEGAVRVWCRTVRLYYCTRAEAAHDGYEPPSDATIEGSAEIHKLDGLRGGAKRLFQRVARGEERRVCLRPVEELLSSGALRSGVPWIKATGYRTRVIPIRTPSGEPIELASTGGVAEVDGQLRLLTRAGTVLHGAFGLGLGYPRRARAKVLWVGVNFFHGADSDAILAQIMPARPRASVKVAAASQYEIKM